MARLIYSAIASLDGYVADADGNFEFLAPDEEVHAYVNELERPVGTCLYGRRMYDVLVAWETWPLEGTSAITRDWAELWRAADKVVYSRTLQEPRSARTRIEREFDPEAVRRMKAESDRDISIGGPELAGQALAAGLVDEVVLLLYPIVIGGGNRALADGLRLELELRDERRFAAGVVCLRYAAAGSDAS